MAIVICLPQAEPEGIKIRLTTKSRYGLRALTDLAEQDLNVPQPLVQIAARQDLSVKYLEQTFLLLRKAGLVRSVKGTRGGYLLTDDPAKITLDHVIAVLEGDTDLIGMSADSSDSQTPLHLFLDRTVWEPLNSLTASFYAGLTLADIAGSPERRHSAVRLARSAFSK
ncbi:MAG: Rrf2 family transcriptional regulator [Bacillota bacterium]|nr:Rrf2 family transcriptional regulator [Bacillota bacterium]